MHKAIVLLKKKDGLTREQFIEYYENVHVPLIRRLLPSIGEYRRNYLDLSLGTRPDPVRHPGFDVITEIWFPDSTAWEQFIADARNPEVAAAIAEDELNFLDRSANRSIGVDEYLTPVGESISLTQAVAYTPR